MIPLKALSLITALIILTSLQLLCQQAVDDGMVGTWTVSSIKNLMSDIPKDKKEIMSSMENAFLKSKFKFGDDKKFSFDFVYEEMKVTNAHWKMEKQANRIIVQEWRDKVKDAPILMEIEIERVDNKVFFIIADSPFVLEVKKID